MDDARLDQLIRSLLATGDGFANNMVMKPELLDALRELQIYRDKPLHCLYRDKPLHCPGCDGDHL